MRGIVVRPESTSPFTPIFESSNIFTSSVLSYWFPESTVVAILFLLLRSEVKPWG